MGLKQLYDIGDCTIYPFVDKLVVEVFEETKYRGWDSLYCDLIPEAVVYLRDTLTDIINELEWDTTVYQEAQGAPV